MKRETREHGVLSMQRQSLDRRRGNGPLLVIVNPGQPASRLNTTLMNSRLFFAAVPRHGDVVERHIHFCVGRRKAVGYIQMAIRIGIGVSGDC